MLRSGRAKLMLSHLGLVTLALLVVGFYLLRSVNWFHLSAMHYRMRDEAAILSERLGPDLSAGNRESIQQYLAAIGPYVSMRVLVADAEGTIIGSTEPEDAQLVGRTGLSYGLSKALRSRIEMVTQGESQPMTDVVYLVSPVDWEGRQVGSIRLSYRLVHLYRELDRLTSIILIGLAAALGVGVVLSLLLAQGLSASARRLAMAARALSAGDLGHRVGARGRDEISEAGHALDDLAERLQKLEWARQQLLGDVSHDLHSSVTGVAMAVETLQRGAADDPPMRTLLLDGLASHCRRLHRMADDLLLAARIEAGRLQLRWEKVGPSALLRTVVAEFAAEAAERGVKLELESGAELPALWADGDRLAQALGNLVENAIRCTPSGGAVVLSGEVRGTECLLHVRDEGPGIPAQELPKLFDRFNRWVEGRPGRLGFGLAIAKGLVEGHGGRIKVTTQQAQGSVFTVILPLGDGGVTDHPKGQQK